MKSLVTGGAGFIGSKLVDRLVADGEGVRILDAFNEGSVDRWVDDPRVEVIHGDLRDSHSVERAVQGVERIFHLGALCGSRPSMGDSRRWVETNVGGTALLLEQMDKHRVRRLIYASSAAVYGGSGGMLLREDRAPQPVSNYGATKLGAEGLISAWHHGGGGSAVVARFFNVYGPGQRKGRVVQHFMAAARRKRPIPIFGDGRTTRDYMHVQDAVSALMHAGVKYIAPRTGAVTVNIGTGRGTTLMELVQILREITGKPMNIELLTHQAGDAKHAVANVERASIELGWKSAVDLRDGLGRTWEALRSQSRPRRRP